jgi:zinc transporter ZupT
VNKAYLKQLWLKFLLLLEMFVIMTVIYESVFGQSKLLEMSKSSSVYYGVFLSFWAGMATGLGGVVAVGLMDFFRDKDKGVHGVLAFSLALAAGVMITVSVVDLWFPLAVKDGLMLPTFTVCVGMASFQIISSAVNATKFCQQHHHSHSHHLQHSLLPLTDKDCEEKFAQAAQQRNLKVAAMMFLALTLHNFPEGTSKMVRCYR